MSDDITPGPRHHVAEFTPDSKVSMPMWKFLAILGAVASGSLTLWQGYAGIGHRFDTQDARLVLIDSKLSQSDPAKIRELIDLALDEKLRKQKPVVQCPRHVPKGDAVAECRFVFPKNDDR